MAQVAIVTRTRDRIVLLRRAMASVAAQTFRDFQVIIVNDGGDPRAVDALVAGFEGIGEPVVIHNAESAGREQAVNVGAAAAEAPLVAVLDDDDTWAPGYLQATVDFLAANPDGAVAVRTEVVFEEIDGDQIRELRREQVRTDLHIVTLLETLYGNFVPPSSMVVRRDLFESLGGWDGSLPVLADWEFALKVLSSSSIGFIDGEPLAFWHRRETQSGPLGNSVHASRDDHVAFTPVVRDTFLKADTANGASLGNALVVTDAQQRLSSQLDLARQDLINHLAGNTFELARQYAPLHEKLDGIAEQLTQLDVQLQELQARSFPARARRAASKAKSGVNWLVRTRTTSKTDDHAENLE